jgi:hypothetical protein
MALDAVGTPLMALETLLFVYAAGSAMLTQPARIMSFGFVRRHAQRAERQYNNAHEGQGGPKNFPH